jgi:PAS domain S-box-containing protein
MKSLINLSESNEIAYLLQLSEDLVFIINSNLKIQKIIAGKDYIFLNDFNRNHSDAENISFISLIYEKYKKNAKDFLKELFKRGEASEELIFFDNRGKKTWFEVKGQKFTKKSDDFAYIYAKNITKFKKREEKLIESMQSLMNDLKQLNNSTTELRFWKVLYPQGTIEAVQKTCKMLETVLDNIPQYIYWKDSDLKYMGCNKKFAELNELKNQSSIIRKTDEDLIWSSQNIEKIRKSEIEVIKNNKSEHNKIAEWTLESGDKVIYNINRIPFIKGNNEVIGVLATYEDITEKKKNEKKISESEEKYRKIIENLKTGYFEVDIEGNFTLVNDAFCKMVGYNKQELYNTNYASLVIEQNRKKIQKYFNIAIQSGVGITDFKFEGYTKDGEKIIAESNIYIKTKNGENIGFYGLIRDVTDKALLESKLRESEIKYRHLFNSAHHGIWLVDLTGKIIDCNDTMNHFLSILTKEDLIGKHYMDVLKTFTRMADYRFKKLQKLLRERFLRFVKQGYLEEPFIFGVNRADGKLLWITLESSFINIGNKKLVQVFIRDITKRKLAEIELESLRRELEKRVKDRTLKLESSEKKYRKAFKRANLFKGLFTHDISNIFQTVGNSIELSGSLLKNGAENNKFLEYFELIDHQISRGKKLIHNIRNLSEMEESEMPIVPVEVCQNLAKAIKFLKMSFQNRNINVIIKSSQNKIYVLANELLLDVFENILINSVRYNKREKVEIEIAISKITEYDKKFVKIEFKDNGIGIDDNLKAKIFQVINKKRTYGKGMGLGLSLVAKLLELCEGRIWIEDRIKGDYSQGSIFIILIPEAARL